MQLVSQCRGAIDTFDFLNTSAMITAIRTSFRSANSRTSLLASELHLQEIRAQSSNVQIEAQYKRRP